MGTLYYGSQRLAVVIADRPLAHLKAVMLAKLRRNEGFGFSWSKGMDEGSGRCTVWVHPAIELQFDFDDAARPALNRAWLEVLTRQASTSLGLTLVEEPQDAPAS